jgi:hypothetical protein
LPANGKPNGKPDNLATVMTQVSERVTLLVKEELELAKAEVTQKVSSLSKGLIAGGIGVVFALLLIPFALLALALGLNSALTSIWLGFVIVAGLLLVLMGGAFLFAWRKIKGGAPAPKMAIEEARKIRQTVAAKGNGNGNGNGAAPIVPVVAPAAVVSPPAPVAEALADAVPAPAVPAAAVITAPAVPEPALVDPLAAAADPVAVAPAPDAPAPIASAPDDSAPAPDDAAPAPADPAADPADPPTEVTPPKGD